MEQLQRQAALSDDAARKWQVEELERDAKEHADKGLKKWFRPSWQEEHKKKDVEQHKGWEVLW